MQAGKGPAVLPSPHRAASGEEEQSQLLTGVRRAGQGWFQEPFPTNTIPTTPGPFRVLTGSRQSKIR